MRITRPDDWHLHLRDGQALADVVGHTARAFGRAIVMPNLKPPVVNAADAIAYRQRILDVAPEGFEPLMTLYLKDSTTPEILEEAKKAGVVAVKLYPAGATTNSDAGVRDLSGLDPALRALTELGMPLLIHGEVTDHHVDIFDREAEFLSQQLAPMLERHPELRVVVEHITTSQAVDFVRAAGDRVGATITAHHMILNRNAIFQGGIRPHAYCLPVLKREHHRQALVAAATSNDPSFFLGTDSAPHTRSAKESACGCAGMYTASHAIELYAEVFEDAGALDQLEAFASFRGPDFYGLPRNTDTIELVREESAIPASFPFNGEEVVPFRAGGTTRWSLRD